jgi:hypothetical protein
LHPDLAQALRGYAVHQTLASGASASIFLIALLMRLAGVHFMDMGHFS